MVPLRVSSACNHYDVASTRAIAATAANGTSTSPAPSSKLSDDQHALRHGGPGLTGWHEWLVARRGSSCSHAWLGQVLHIALPEGWDNIADLPPEDENQAIEVLFQLLDEFAAEREASTDVQILG